MEKQSALLLREYLSEEAALLLENSTVFRRCLGAAWENDAGEEVERLINELTRAATSAHHASRKLSRSGLADKFDALHGKMAAGSGRAGSC